VPYWALCLLGFLIADRVPRPTSPPYEVPTCSVDAAPLPAVGPSPRDLRPLPGIGAVRALLAARAAWEHDRRAGPLNWEAVPGLGPVSAAALRSQVRIGSQVAARDGP